mgnify:CR=1 FL=1
MLHLGSDVYVVLERINEPGRRDGGGGGPGLRGAQVRLILLSLRLYQVHLCQVPRYQPQVSILPVFAKNLRLIQKFLIFLIYIFMDIFKDRANN